MWKTLQKADKWLDSHLVLWGSLILLSVLRVPNFFEPYWYGDEGIYLTIGTALRQGGILYQTIVDHKTPLIYFLAMVPSLVYFRVLLFIFSVVSTVTIFFLSEKLLHRGVSKAVALLSFVLLTSLPFFEGHIANGEHFVMGFVLLGWALLCFSSEFSHLLHPQQRFHLTKSAHASEHFLTSFLFLVSGSLFGLALLTKVPALFDSISVLVFIWWLWISRLKFSNLTDWTLLKSQLYFLFRTVGLFLIGVLIPLLISILYFYQRGALSDYLQFGLLYNFHYAANWGLPFTQSWLVAAFSLPGKATLVAIILALLTLFHRKLQGNFLVIASWFVLALFASLLSNRPYPHYFLQLFPPLVLLLGLSIDRLIAVIKKQHITMPSIELTASTFLILLFFVIVVLLRVGLYSTTSYYQTFISYITGKIGVEEYRQSFNPLMKDNYHVAPLLHSGINNQLFIWGTNPSLYALSRTVPVGKFTVSFHIHDLKAYSETYEAVTSIQPEFIVIMNDESNTFPELTNWVKLNYIPNTTYDYFTVWKRQIK